MPYLDEEKIKDIDCKEILNQFEMKKLEIQKEKEKNRTIKIELNRMLRQDARFEMFWDEVKQSIETAETPVFTEYTINSGERVGIVGISDIHFGAKFKSLNNEYSIAICIERMSRLLFEIYEWIEERNLSHIHVVNTADNLEGLIHKNQLTILETGVIDSAIEFGRMMAEWLNKLSEKIHLTYHHVQSANHSEVRYFSCKAGEFPKEDLERVIINYIHDVLKYNPRITVPMYEQGYAIFQINGKNIMAMHGHQLHGKKIGNVINELQMLHGIKISILLLGHFHHEEIHTVGEEEIGNVKVIIFPSIMGSNEYSDKILAGSKAGSTFIEFDALKKGLKFTEVILN
jgi:hypothetical protein